MTYPTWTLVTLSSRGLYDLRETIEAFRKALTALRRRVVFRSVRSGCGALEAMLVRTPLHWEVHAHLVLDVDLLDFPAVDAAWKGYHDGRGKFQAARRANVDMNNVVSLAAYTAKADTWCPPPGVLSLTEFEALLEGLHSKRLLIGWGGRR